MRMLLGLAPWVLFTVLTRLPVDGVAAPAAVVAALASLAIVIVHSRGGVKIVEATSVVTFGVLAVVGYAVTGGDTWITDYGRAAAAAVLGAVMLISAATVPFSEQYARESVPAAYLHSPLFRAANRKISAMWGAIMIVMTVSHLAAAALLSADGGSERGQLLLNWGVPGLLVFFGFKQTKKMAATAHGSPAGVMTQP